MGDFIVVSFLIPSEVVKLQAKRLITAHDRELVFVVGVGFENNRFDIVGWGFLHQCLCLQG